MDRVQLDELTTVNFRNIRRSSIKPCRRFNIVSGRNGMGKTNLIEAIYLMGALRSFRTTARRDLVCHGEEAARVTGVFGQVSAGLKCEITISQDLRKITVDSKPVSVDGGHFRTLPMVLFHPGNMELVQGGPEFRRRFMDRALFQAMAEYPSLHRSYTRALMNRNRILKRRPANINMLEPFDLQLSQTGSRIVSMRTGFIESLSAFLSEAVREVSGGNEGTVEYKPRIQGSPESFMETYRQRFSVDLEKGYTTRGPHADDIVFWLDGRPARTYGSQGQQRTMVLAAKIAEVRVLTQSTGRVPLLLFDDVSSELDRNRNEQLFEFLSNVGGQVFITTTHRDHIPIVEDRRDFLVENGVVSNE